MTSKKTAARQAVTGKKTSPRVAVAQKKAPEQAKKRIELHAVPKPVAPPELVAKKPTQR